MIKKVFSYLLLVGLVGLFVWRQSVIKGEKHELEMRGEITQGEVVRVVNRRRGIDFKYQFRVNGNSYDNWSKTYNPVTVGDTIKVIYVPNKPLLNKFLKEN